MERPLFGPEDEQRTLNLLIQVRLVVRQIDGRGRPVVLANRMDRGGIAESTKIFLKYGSADKIRNRFVERMSPKPKQCGFQEILGAICDHRLGKRIRLDEKK